jgi:small conductance mechanosensitive channel
VRNGTIKRAGNETHGWARAVVDFPVPYQLSVATARATLEQAAVSMWEDPAWQLAILDRPEVWGVQDISASSILIRIAVRTAPQAKLEVTRELWARLKDALDAVPGPAAGATAAVLADSVPQQPEPPRP